MYESFYGLKIKPFQLNPDPNFWFGSKPHRRAKAYLDYGVSRNEGFIVITGEVGAGKTTVLAELLAGLDRTEVVVGQIVTTQLDADDTLRMVAGAYGLPVKDVPKAELLIGLEAFLVTQASRGKRCLLVVDEAQNLNQRAVEELRMLSNYQLGTQSLLQSFLVGQPEFRQILQKPEMEQFRQRIAASCHLGPLDLDDTRGYVEHRLGRAGAGVEPIFLPEAYAPLHTASGGIPRRINVLADRLLLLGFLEGRRQLGADDVRRVAAELTEEITSVRAVPAAEPAADATPAVAPAAAVVEPAPTPAPLRVVDPEAHDERLQRIERSMLRIERIQMQTLAMLRELAEELKHDVDHGDGGKAE
jgi:general secretion pathway protein A